MKTEECLKLLLGDDDNYLNENFDENNSEDENILQQRDDDSESDQNKEKYKSKKELFSA